jgi:hypothetical protein
MSPPPPAPTDPAKAAADLMSRQRWADAARAWESLAAPMAAIQARLCRNLAAMQVHRPAVYRTLLAAGGEDRYRLGTSRTGLLTLHYLNHEGRPLSLSPGDDPATAVAQALASLQTALAAGATLAFAGIGDGYLLHHVARHPPKLYMDRQQVAHVIEPDPKALLAALLVHDYTGPLGPIEHERFCWWVGLDWRPQLLQATEADPYLPVPTTCISLGVRGKTIEQALVMLGNDATARDGELARRLGEHYRALDAAHFHAALEQRLPGRRSRVLLLTTRFSSVLQYSTRDTAAALEELGFETLVVIEPAASRAITRLGLRRLLDRFRPDLVLQIDHHRHEHADVFPPQLPFVCWAQDNLANLTSVEAGAKLGSRDFMLSGLKSMYVRRYGYPDRQCIELAKLTRVPTRPAAWRSDGDDLVFVSNASQTPHELRRQIVGLHQSAECAQLLAACCDAIEAVYAGGNALFHSLDVARVVRATEDRVHLRFADPAEERSAIDLLFDRFNNLLYRQQALAWAADVADELGLSMALYGSGWETHPRFARHARGPVTYGEPLERLTRQSRINLQIVPFYCMHQRLLDGVVAGGFFLVRDHPSVEAMHALADVIVDHLPADATDVPSALASVRGEARLLLQRALRDAEHVADWGDPIEIVRGAIAMQNLLPHQPPMPHLEAVTFRDRDSLRACVRRFIADPESRRRIALEQAAAVEGRLSYAAGMKRVLARLATLLAGESAIENASRIAA